MIVHVIGIALGAYRRHPLKRTWYEGMLSRDSVTRVAVLVARKPQSATTDDDGERRSADVNLGRQLPGIFRRPSWYTGRCTVGIGASVPVRSVEPFVEDRWDVKSAPGNPVDSGTQREVRAGLRVQSVAAGGVPVPGQRVVQPCVPKLSDAGEHISKAGLRTESVPKAPSLELGRTKAHCGEVLALSGLWWEPPKITDADEAR